MAPRCLPLRITILLWVFLATAVPLTGVVFFAAVYSDHLYREDLGREVMASLSSIVSELSRRLLLEREVVRALANTPAMQDFLPVLESATDGELHPEFVARSAGLSDLFETFQSVIPSLSTVRVLDGAGNTIVKVQDQRRVESVYEGLLDIPYVEQELREETVQSYLRGLHQGEVGFTLLPQTLDQSHSSEQAAFMETVIALGRDDRELGFLAISFSPQAIDRLLSVMPRPVHSDLFIAELNTEIPERDGLILYDDQIGLLLAADLNEASSSRVLDANLYSAMEDEPEGVAESPDGGSRIYFIEYLPYPDQLTSWVVASRVDVVALGSPVQPVRAAVLASPFIVLVISLLLAQFGARKIAEPVVALGRALGSFAEGRRDVRVQSTGPQEIVRASRAFNDMAETVEQAEREREAAHRAMLQSAKLASIGEMAAGVGHEINNPLNNILSLTKLIDRALPDSLPRLRGDVKAVREEALRASRIVSGVLNFARQVEPEYSRFDVGTWIQSTLSLIERELATRGVRVHRHVPEPLTALGDRDLLGQTLINLVTNALHASPAGSVIDIFAVREGGNLRIDVEDRGPGLRAADIDRVFDPFYTTKPVGQGSGLGLSISLGIVELHHGELRLSDRPQGGVRATVLLPAGNAPQSALGGGVAPGARP
jgi:two-component system NtrC family sensor kinase